MMNVFSNEGQIRRQGVDDWVELNTLVSAMEFFSIESVKVGTTMREVAETMRRFNTLFPSIAEFKYQERTPRESPGWLQNGQLPD